MNFFFVLILTLIATPSFGQSSKDSIDFSITFSGCFENETVGLSINGLTIFSNLKITTANNGLGISNVGIYQNGKYLILNIDNQTRQLKRVVISDTLKCDITKNKKLQNFKIALKWGNNIFIDNCNLYAGRGKDLTINQYRGIVYLD